MVALRFTRADFLSDTADRRLLIDDGGYILGGVTLRDDQFFGAKLSLQAVDTVGPALVIGITNNVFERCDTVVSHYYDEVITANLLNNLFIEGKLSMSYAVGTFGSGYNPAWTLKDNLFVATTNSGASSYILAGNNGYTATNAYWGGSSNKTGLVTTGTGGFQAGPLGPWYYPTSGTDLARLLDAGSRSAAAAGLFHFTTITNLEPYYTNGVGGPVTNFVYRSVREAGTPVDIGFHYYSWLEQRYASGVLIDIGVLDQDGDKLLDYLEDTDGDGIVDMGETNPASFNADADGLWDLLEVYTYGTDPDKADTDNDGVNDGRRC